MRDFHAGLIKDHGQFANELLKQWVTALSIGHGAALLGIFSLVKDKPLLLYILLPSAWMFFFGLTAASLCHFCLLASNRKNHEYWMLEDANTVRAESGLDISVECSAEAEKADRAGNNWGRASGYFAIFSAVIFVVAGLMPLVALTSRAFRGVL